MAKGKQPDYDLSALITDTNTKGTVGAAWVQPDGRISIKLNNFVTLTGSDKLMLNLFPREQPTQDRTPKPNPFRERADARKKGAEPPPDPDDIPF